MQGRRTYTTRFQIFLFVVLLVAAVLGYRHFAQLSFRLNPSSQYTLTLTTQGTFSSPLEMALSVTLPLENALSGIRSISSIQSESSAARSTILLKFHNRPGPTVYNQLRQVLRETSATFPEGTAYPVLDGGSEHTEGLSVICWMEDSQASMPSYVSSIAELIERIPETSVQPGHLPSLSAIPPEVAFIPVSENGYQLLSALSTGRSGSPVFFKDHLLNTAHATLEGFAELELPSEVKSNAFPAVRLVIRPGKRTNVLWWRLKMLRELTRLSRHSDFRFYVGHDPWLPLVSSHRTSAIFLGFLLCVLALRSWWLRSVRIVYALLFPGLFFFVHAACGQVLSPFSLWVAEYLWLICILLLLTTRQKIPAAGAYGLLMAWVCCLVLAGQEVISPEWPAVSTTLATGLTVLLCSILPCIRFTPPAVPGNAVPWLAIMIFMTAGGLLLQVPGGKPGNWYTALSENHKPYPPDRTPTSPQLILQAQETRYTAMQSGGPDSVADVLERFEPGLLLYEKENNSYRLTASWESVSEEQILTIRETLKSLLVSQSGIRWTMDGTGGFFQNEREFFPGTYQLELAGPDYQALLRQATRAGDSIRTLPGTARVEVNTDAFASALHYTFAPARHNPEILKALRQSVQPGLPAMDTAGFFRRPFVGKQGIFSLLGTGTLQRMEHPAPVRRANGRYIIGIKYAHYAGEKYAMRFFQQLCRTISQSLPPGMEIIPPKNGGSQANRVTIFIVLLAVLCFSIQPVCGRKAASAANLTALLSMVAVLYYLHYGHEFPIVAGCLILFTVWLFLLLPEGSSHTILSGYAIWGVWEAAGFLLAQSGKQVMEHLFMCWLILSFCCWYVAGRLWSVAGGRKCFQKLFDLIRLGMITKLVK